jgi:hypothetical protein
MGELKLLARVARLTAERVYHGLSEPMPLAEVKAGDFVFGPPELKEALAQAGIHAVWVERDCDLPPWRYRLVAPQDDHPVWRFVSLEDELEQRSEQVIELGITLALARGRLALLAFGYGADHAGGLHQVQAPGLGDYRRGQQHPRLHAGRRLFPVVGERAGRQRD